MDMETYLEKLRYYLGNLGTDEKEEIIEDFREHFLMAVQQGETEEEVSRMLGSPDEIARQYMGASKAQESWRDRAENSGYKSETSFNKKFPADQIHEICVNMVNCSLQFAGVEQSGDITVDIQGKHSVMFSSQVVDGVLTIKQEVPGGDEFLFHRLFNFMGANIEAKVTIPKSFAGIVDLHNRSGSMKIDDLKNLQSGKIRTGSGSIRITEAGGNLEVSTGSGSIHVEGFTGIMQARTGSGSIHMEAGRITNESSFSTGSGGIRLCAERVDAGMRLRTGSGGIKIEIKELFANLWASTGSGGIDCAFDRKSPVSIIAKRASGKIKNEFTSISAEMLYQVNLTTGSGGITVKNLSV